jgi:pimeloyl-ACP methyl ester carboxylesterase
VTRARDSSARGGHASGRRLLATSAVAALVLVAPVSANSTNRHDGPHAGGVPTHGRFAGLVEIRGARRLYVECRGSGSPTVVLEAGTGDRGDVWSAPPSGPGRAVLPAVSRFTRVCAYDRPGTFRGPNAVSRSDPVAMPRTARDIALDLRALLRPNRLAAPYVLVGHSFGGMVARLYATTYPRRIAGLVSVDAQSEWNAAALKRFLTPAQYAAAVLNPQPPPGLENYPDVERLLLEPSAAEMRQAQADTPLRRMPLVVISHSPDRPNPFGFPPDWPIEALDRAFNRSQEKLAKLVPGARHEIAARSGHYIQLDQPGLVTRAIRRVVKETRRGGSTSRLPTR